MDEKQRFFLSFTMKLFSTTLSFNIFIFLNVNT